MNNPSYKVLLYLDGTRQTVSTAVYAATLLKNISNVQLTIITIQEKQNHFQGTKFSIKELRRVYKRCYWEMESETSPSYVNWLNICPQEEFSSEEFSLILSKANRIFWENAENVKQQTLCTNINTADIQDTSDIILDYTRKNGFNLILMGAESKYTLNNLVFGSLAHRVQRKSTIPVLLIQELTREFIDTYLFDLPGSDSSRNVSMAELPMSFSNLVVF